MIINNSTLCLVANKKFGNFHDGFIKKIEISSGNKFCQEMPWEPKQQYKSNEEKLLATGLCYFGGKLIKLIIQHYCYEWPNQPWNQEIKIYIPRANNILPNIIDYVGVDLFALSFQFKNNQIILNVSTHTIPPKDQKISIENCTTRTLCTSTKVRIIERKT